MRAASIECRGCFAHQDFADEKLLTAGVQNMHERIGPFLYDLARNSEKFAAWVKARAQRADPAATQQFSV